MPVKLFTCLSSFSALTSQLFCLFSFLNIHLSSSSAFIMQQVTSHIPLVNLFFSGLVGFSGFFSTSPKRTSLLERVVVHRLPRASTVRSDFTKVTSSSHHVLNLSGEFELTTMQEAVGFVRLLDDDTLSFLLKLFHCIMPPVDIFFSQLQKRTINSVFVRESCSSSHSFSNFSVHYFIPAVAGH